MAEKPDQESKTEEATEKKIKDSLEKGQVPHSREAATFASMLGVLIGILFLLDQSVLSLKTALVPFLEDPGSIHLNNGTDASTLIYIMLLECAKVVGPVVLVMMIASVAANVFQNPPRLVGERVKPKLDRISIKSGWSRLFGLKGQVEFLKSVSKLIIVGTAGYIAIGPSHRELVDALFMETTAVPSLMQELIIRFLTAVVVATGVLVAADLVWSRFSWSRDIRMTKQEVKDEFKQTEGDPLIKMRLRSLQRDRSRKRMIDAVPKATLVVTNPTHYAVAMRYVREEGGAPVVLAKGKDLIALKIRFVAEEHEIPIYEDPALARSLYASVEVDKMIPPEFYKAVAGIILFLSQRGKTARPQG